MSNSLVAIDYEMIRKDDPCSTNFVLVLVETGELFNIWFKTPSARSNFVMLLSDKKRIAKLTYILNSNDNERYIVASA